MGTVYDWLEWGGSRNLSNCTHVNGGTKAVGMSLVF